MNGSNAARSALGPAPGLQRRFLRLAVPNALANLTVPIAGLVDTAMLGHLGDIHPLAGVGLGAVIFDYVYWSFGFLRMGTTGLTAQAVGRGERDGVALLLWRPLALALAIAALIVLLRAPLRELGFALLSGDPAVEAAGREYYDARIFGAFATLANFVFVGWLLGRERAGRALALTAIANGANVALDYVFIVQLDLAARGAGLATMCSQYLMLGAALALCARDGLRAPVAWRRVLERGPLLDLLRLNRDILIRTFCLITAFSVFTNLSALLGTRLLAANLILLRIVSFVAYFVDGAAFATESLAGIFKGARDAARLRAVLRLSLFWGEGIALASLVALFALAAPVYGLITTHADVVAEIRRYELWLWLALPFGAAAYVFDGFFIGLATGRILRNAMLVSVVGVFAPAALAAWALGSNHALWLAFSGFLAARTLTLEAARRIAGEELLSAE